MGGCRRGYERPVRHSVGVRDGGGLVAPKFGGEGKSALRELFTLLFLG